MAVVTRWWNAPLVALAVGLGGLVGCSDSQVGSIKATEPPAAGETAGRFQDNRPGKASITPPRAPGEAGIESR